jgi:putative serine/threonine protein kinase
LPEAKQVQVERIPGTKYARILTYPAFSENKARERAHELREAGITSLQFTGTALIDGIQVLGKGCVGIVVKALLDGSPVALKIRRDDADRPSMINEATMLRLANSVETGPRLTTATRDFLAMELLDGLPLFRWVEQFARQSEVRRILRDLLYSCFRLDSIGLDHGELSHAPKNILVNKGGKACIVDFESASTTRRVANVTSLLQYFLFGRISRTIRASRLFPGRRTILGTLSEYKQERSVENFQIILGSLGLA